MEVVDLKMKLLDDKEIEYLYKNIKKHCESFTIHPYISISHNILNNDDYNQFKDYCKEGEVVILLLKRVNAVSHLLQVCGQLNPKECIKINKNSLRGEYGSNLIRNGFYCSLNYEDSLVENKMFFNNKIDQSNKKEIKSLHRKDGKNGLYEVSCLYIPINLFNEENTLSNLFIILNKEKYQINNMKIRKYNEIESKVFCERKNKSEFIKQYSGSPVLLICVSKDNCFIHLREYLYI